MAVLAYKWAMPDQQTVGPPRHPHWLTCNYVGVEGRCIGRRVDDFSNCLAHIGDSQRAQTLAQLHPGSSLDASGTPVSAALLSQILHAVQNKDGSPEFGSVSFAWAHFSEDADFNRVRFTGPASFDHATFEGHAKFTGAVFTEDARFSRAKFSREARFASTNFGGAARFGGANFGLGAMFRNAQFAGAAIFGESQFSRSTNFSDAQFNQGARFVSAQFEGNIWFIAASFGESARFENAKFAAVARFHGAQFARNAVFGHSEFGGTAAFINACFDEGAGFESALFSGAALFRNAVFGGAARFDGAHFSSNAVLDGARFRERASFNRAKFSGQTMLRGAQFNGNGTFGRVEFCMDAAFDRAQFTMDASFTDALFRGNVTFDRVQFHQNAIFDDASFERAGLLGPLSASNLSLRRTVFSNPLRIDAAAADVSCHDTAWRAGVTLRLRYAAVDLDRATFTVPSFVGGADQEFESVTGVLAEDRICRQVIARRGESPDLWVPVLLSIQGVDAFNLSVTDVDLSRCRFAGARVLDQLRLEGRCIFDHPPDGLHAGWAWPLTWRWSSRQSLAEERIWRATTSKYSGWADRRSDKPAEVRPERLAGLYRQLRKAQEDAKNEPGAADLYYGEMEMRRRARATPVAERGILWLYWLISGYGLRAVRSLAALAIVGLLATVALIGWGLGANAPVTTPSQRLAGTVTATAHKPARINATLSGLTPELPPSSQRWTSDRARTALEVTLESFVFRSTDQPLTDKGTWITIATRILGPVLLALSLLAVRNRVKR